VRQVHRTGGFEDVAGYSRAVRVGDHVAVSATAPIDEDGQTLYLGDTYQQTRYAFERAIEAVVALGGAVSDVTRTRMYLIREADWRKAVDAHVELFADVLPANSTFYVEGFIPPGVLVEVELDAIISSG
jgi:enamine deaminase RidA (YjgF/YER057c/UK114 family)